MEINNLHKRGNKTGAKLGEKASRSGYHLFLMDQFDKMLAQNQRNHHSIVSER